MADPEIPKEQIDALIRSLERIERKRKIMLAGYLVALVVLVGGELAAMYAAGRAGPGTFMAWVFLLPFAGVGLAMWIFGRWAKRQ